MINPATDSNPSHAQSSIARRLSRALFLFAIAAAATTLFFSLRGYRRVGGDNDFAAGIVQQPFDMFYLRSPLTVYVNQAVYHFIFQPRGWSPEAAVGFCSAMAGGIFVVALLSISTRWPFLLFNLTAPLLFIFLGHVEHYGWVNALLVVYFLAVKRNLEGGRPLWPALIWLLLAASFHMLAVFYIPSLLYLMAERDRETQRSHWRTAVVDREFMLIIMIMWSGAITISQMILHVGGLDNNIHRLVPLIWTPGKGHYFALFSWAHLKMWLYFHWKASPLGLPLLALLIWTIRTRFEKFLLVATGCAFLWTWMWHPDRSERDWDLFANLALPMNVLVGLLLARLALRLSRSTPRPESGHLRHEVAE